MSKPKITLASLPPMRFKVEKLNAKGVWRQLPGGWTDRGRAESYVEKYCAPGKARVIDIRPELES